ncbi:MAG TPA: SDR family oxidoreductase [Bacteroidales bacterium]|nr:SDR family oxidoreductase [Bacteroidales bacterium]
MSNLENLKDKVCVITGGGGVIGSALASGLAKSGVIPVILDINAEAAKKVAEEVTAETGTKAYGFMGNVLDKASLEETQKEIIAEVGDVDFLINGAGGNSPKATTQLEELTENDLNALGESFFGLELEGFQKVFDLNFTGTLLPSMVFAEPMVKRQKGAIINVSSMNAYKPLTKIPAYSAAKASINNFTEWLAVHFAKAGVRVNAIAPGFFLTHQNRFLLVDEKSGDLTARGNKIIANTPMGSFGEPGDITGTALFLLSDMSHFITGICIPVDGGYSAFGGV